MPVQAEVLAKRAKKHGNGMKTVIAMLQLNAH